MSNVRDISELMESIRGSNSALDRASKKALVKVTLDAERAAKFNAVRNFTGRNGYTLSGMLLNSIYSGFEGSGDNLSGFVGTRTIPYGRIQEEGGTITPKTAKHLWVKNYNVGGAAKRMTPKEFMLAKERSPREYAIFKSKRGTMVAWKIEGRGQYAKATALFFLLDSVEIPSRPYVGPAVEDAAKAFTSTSPAASRRGNTGSR